MMIGPSILSKIMKTLEQLGIRKDNKYRFQYNKYISFSISLIMYYISLQISKRIYMKREF